MKITLGKSSWVNYIFAWLPFDKTKLGDKTKFTTPKYLFSLTVSFGWLFFKNQKGSGSLSYYLPISCLKILAKGLVQDKPSHRRDLQRTWATVVGSLSGPGDQSLFCVPISLWYKQTFLYQIFVFPSPYECLSPFKAPHPYPLLSEEDSQD